MLHGNYCRDIGHDQDGLVVSELIEYDDGTIEPNLRPYKAPKVNFWVTQQQYRNHTDKKEFEKLSKLDAFQAPYRDIEKAIFEVLNGYYPRFLTPKQRTEIRQNPFVYGANITLEARIAMKYKDDLDKLGKTPHTPTTGFFDIEQSLLPSSYGKLPLMVFVAENKVFLAMMKSFMYEDHNGKMEPVTVEDIRSGAHEHIDTLINSIFAEKGKDLAEVAHMLPFTYEFFVGETEVDMIRWIFDKMHECKTSFIGIWNLGFDIGEILKILERENIPLEDIFVHPKFRGTGYAHAYYKEDKRKVQHYSQKWHWLSATAYFQFIDSMALYSYIRQVDGKEASYKLDDILKKFGLGGKLKIDKTKDLEGLQEADWHRAMLSRHFVSYALYAMWDGISLQILEWLNRDLTAMVDMGGVTSPKFFPNQTIRVTNTFFHEWKPKGYILGTGIDIEAPRDEDLLTAGGAVLEPQHLVAKGLRLFIEWPSHHTHVYAWQNDLDFSAQYPSAISVMNISKQTKLSTMFCIKGDHVSKLYSPEESVEVLCSYLVTPNANGVELGTEFFNLPDYMEMDQLFKQRMGVNHM